MFLLDWDSLILKMLDIVLLLDLELRNQHWRIDVIREWLGLVSLSLYLSKFVLTHIDIILRSPFSDFVLVATNVLILPTGWKLDARAQHKLSI